LRKRLDEPEYLRMQALVARFGLLAIFLGAAVEGDSTLILTGVIGHLGLVDFPLAVIVGACGAFLGDCVFFGLGRTGSAALEEHQFYRRMRPVIERLVGRFGAWEIVVTRFVYGTRIASMVFWGTQAIALGRFVIFELLGCTLWAGVLASLGYLFSSSAVALLGRVRRVEIWLLIAAVVTASAVAGIRIASRRRLQSLQSASRTRQAEG
jgi:membrane protein DedA with SNARE-associated domain